jgi:hypothetical protein
MSAPQPDMSATIAAFLNSVAPAWPPDAIVKTLVARWPNLSKEDYVRALDVAIEVRQGTLAECQAQLRHQSGDDGERCREHADLRMAAWLPRTGSPPRRIG